jgi:predicted amidohydrolase
LHDYADVCCVLHDRLDDDLVRDHGPAWVADASVNSRALDLAGEIEGGGTRPSRVYMLGVNRGPVDTFIALRGLDLALCRVNPRLRGGERTPVPLLELESRLRRTGRLSTDATVGALIPELTLRDQSGPPTHKRDLLQYVRRVPAASWERTDLQLIAPSKHLRRRDLRDGLEVACVPVIADPNEMLFAIRDTPAGPVYRIAPRDLAHTRARVGEIVSALDGSAIHLALAPELTLTPQLLEVWQAELRSCRSRHLRYVLVGTGNIDPIGVRAANRAVLLDGGTGAVLGHQAKLFPFTMTTTITDRWQLRPLLGDGPLAEDLQPAPTRMTVFELGAVRMAILICEDLNKPFDVGPLARDLGISLLLVPVFSRPIQAYHWEQTAGATHAREIGTTVVVANSLVMASVIGTADPATALVVPSQGSALLGHARGPADLARFRLLPNGSAELR